MNITYSINLVILGITLEPKVTLDIFQFYREIKGTSLYRGSLTYKGSVYTLKITRNGFCSVYIRRNFSSLLSNLECIGKEIHDFIFQYCKPDIEKVSIFPRNIQIIFHILFDFKKPNFRIFCSHFTKTFLTDFEYEIKESNSSDSVWLPFNNNLIYFSSFRIKFKGFSKCIFSFSYTYRGNCLTSNVLDFKRVCDCIRKCYLDNHIIW